MIKSIKSNIQKVTSMQDIIDRVCAIVMPNLSDILKELSNNMNDLENILRRIFSNYFSYDVDILPSFVLYYDCNGLYTQCRKVTVVV